MDIEEFKRLVVQHDAMKRERDALLQGVEMPQLSGGMGDIAVLGPMMAKLGDFKKAFELSKEIEAIGDRLIGFKISEAIAHG